MRVLGQILRRREEHKRRIGRPLDPMRSTQAILRGFSGPLRQERDAAELLESERIRGAARVLVESTRLLGSSRRSRARHVGANSTRA